MVRRRAQRPLVGEPVAGRRDEGRVLPDGDLVATDVEGREVDQALRVLGGPALDVEGRGVDGGIASHEEGAAGDLHEAQQLVVGQIPGVGPEPGHLPEGRRPTFGGCETRVRGPLREEEREPHGRDHAERGEEHPRLPQDAPAVLPHANDQE